MEMKVVKQLENENMIQEKEEKQPGFIRIKKFYFIMLLLIVVLASAGITTFALTFGDENPVPVVSERSEFNKLFSAYDTLKDNFYTDLNNEDLVNGAINGMLEGLKDPYSDYMTKEEAKSFYEGISSSFEGIGAEIQERDGNIVIVTPIKGSPAEKAGLRPDDKVIAVDGKNIQGMSSTEAVMLIRGEKGSKVELQIERPGVTEPLIVPIIRDTIPIETVHAEMLPDNIGKVQITSFSENTTNELVKALNDLQNNGMQGLILDLRQNPGGLLTEAIKISSLFVPKGEVIFQIEDRNGNVQSEKSQNTNGTPDMPIVAVIDKGSASAAEILAAALHESADIPLVGEKSFGKGTVQRTLDFTDGSNMKFTIEKWLTPEGTWIHEKGINPDYEVALPPYATLPYINPDTELKLSDSSSSVKAAQQMLKELGFDSQREDGFFDENTAAAVRSFQQSQGFEQTGTVTGETTIKMMELLREKLTNNDTQIQKAVELIKEA
ncbi:S41 family peptidase [Bacillaceae bacterium Marseille-Q3522]|nr:S41 family peptidase [Bacillaceae bacterium Marseille-Q3522]